MNPIYDQYGRYMIHRKPARLEGVRLTVANICSAFDVLTIGSKFRSPAIYAGVCKAIARHSFPENGQDVIEAPELISMVRSGDAPVPKEQEEEHFVLRLYRGRVSRYLHASFAEKVEVKSCRLVVQTKEAYLKDPDCCGDKEAGIPRDQEEFDRINDMDCTHVLVALLASGRPVESTVSPYRFVANLSGGNNDYLGYTKEELVNIARKVKENADLAWCQVADDVDDFEL
ncbi:MAG: hypothetical protein ACXABY_31360 [Candidatus Thorarchaeota archaeon]|jgi:hypothetical protein